MSQEGSPSGPIRLPPLDPEMRSAIARRLLFCRSYRQLKKSLRPHHNQFAARYERLEAGHRLIQWHFVRSRRARAAMRRTEMESGFCLGIKPWWPSDG